MLNLIVDTSKQGLSKVLRKYQELALRYVWEIGDRGVNSRLVYFTVNEELPSENGDQADDQSNQRLLDFLLEKAFHDPGTEEREARGPEEVSAPREERAQAETEGLFAFSIHDDEEDGDECEGNLVKRVFERKYVCRCSAHTAEARAANFGLKYRAAIQ